MAKALETHLSVKKQSTKLIKKLNFSFCNLLFISLAIITNARDIERNLVKNHLVKKPSDCFSVELLLEVSSVWTIRKTKTIEYDQIRLNVPADRHFDDKALKLLNVKIFAALASYYQKAYLILRQGH